MTLGDSSEVMLHRATSVDDLFSPMWRLDVQHDPPHVHNKPGTTSKVNLSIQSPSSSTSEVPTSASDEDQTLQQLDDKKQKRMLSNRESARRSRLRKQQHLEDLRSQLLELRTQNSQILGKLNLATQHFTQLNNDNQVLRSHALELGSHLQRLHRKATDFHPRGLHAYGFGTSHLDPPGVAMVDQEHMEFPSAYSLVQGALGSSSASSILID